MQPTKSSHINFLICFVFVVFLGFGFERTLVFKAGGNCSSISLI